MWPSVSTWSPRTRRRRADGRVTEVALPRPGERYRARRDTVVDVRIVYAAPGSSGATSTLPAGEIVKIEMVVVNSKRPDFDPAATVSLADPTARVWRFKESSPELDAVVTRYRDDPAAGIWVFAQPERSKELETVLVPKDAREWRTYDGYTLWIELDLLLRDFELLPPASRVLTS
jgi:hypothetical protein